MADLTAERVYDIIKKDTTNRDEALELIRKYAREHSEQLRNMIIEEYFKDQDPEIINAVKNKKLPANY